MSALDQKRTCAVQNSAESQKRTSRHLLNHLVGASDQRWWHSQAGSKTDTVALFDHLVGDGEHACRNGEAERLSRRSVDDELEFGRLQHRQVGGLRGRDIKKEIANRGDLRICTNKENDRDCFGLQLWMPVSLAYWHRRRQRRPRGEPDRRPMQAIGRCGPPPIDIRSKRYGLQ